MCQPKFLQEAPASSRDPAQSSKKRKAPTATTATAPASRSKALTLEELQDNFHLPINEVASKLGVCVTVLKQQCRELGIVRWPYRKVRKLDNMLSALESSRPGKVRPFALSNGESERQQKITTVKKTLRELIADPNSCAHLKLGKLKHVTGAAGSAPGAATVSGAAPGAASVPGAAAGATSASGTAPGATSACGTARGFASLASAAGGGGASSVAGCDATASAKSGEVGGSESAKPEDDAVQHIQECNSKSDLELLQIRSTTASHFSKARESGSNKARESGSSIGVGSPAAVLEAASAIVWGPHLHHWMTPSLTLKNEGMSSLTLKGEGMSSLTLKNEGISSLFSKNEGMSSLALKSEGVPPLSSTDYPTFVASSRKPLTNQGSPGVVHESLLGLIQTSVLAEEEGVPPSSTQVRTGEGGASAGSISGSNSSSSRNPVPSGAVSSAKSGSSQAADGEGSVHGRDHSSLGSNQSSVELDLISRLGCDKAVGADSPSTIAAPPSATPSCAEPSVSMQTEAPIGLHHHHHHHHHHPAPSVHEDFCAREAKPLKDSSPPPCTPPPSSQDSHTGAQGSLVGSAGAAPQACSNIDVTAALLSQRMMLSGFASSAAGFGAVGQPGTGDLRGTGGLEFAGGCGGMAPVQLSGLMGVSLQSVLGSPAAYLLHLQNEQLRQLEAQQQHHHHQQQQQQLLALLASSSAQQHAVQSSMTSAAFASLGFAQPSLASMHGLGPHQGLSLPSDPLSFFMQPQAVLKAPLRS